MNKKIKTFALVAAVAAIGGYGVYTNQQVAAMSDLMLENIEALAKIEDPDEGGISPKDCPGGRHLCDWIISPMGSVTYYDENGPDTI